jgi:hypothetical protein
VPEIEKGFASEGELHSFVDEVSCQILSIRFLLPLRRTFGRSE